MWVCKGLRFPPLGYRENLIPWQGSRSIDRGDGGGFLLAGHQDGDRVEDGGFARAVNPDEDVKVWIEGEVLEVHGGMFCDRSSMVRDIFLWLRSMGWGMLKQ